MTVTVPNGQGLRNISLLKEAPYSSVAVTPPQIRSPQATDDNTRGYAVGDEWVDTVNRRIYVASAVGTGAASWSVLPVDFTLPLDIKAVSTGGAAYGTVKLRSAYNGPCMQVVRASDSATYDVGFVAQTLSNGMTRYVADAAGLSAFIGVSTAKISILYDQSGNGLDAVQSTSASRPNVTTNTIDGVLAITMGGSGSDLNLQSRQLVLPAGLTFNRSVWSSVCLHRQLRSIGSSTISCVGDTVTRSAVFSGLQRSNFDGSPRVSTLQTRADSVVEIEAFDAAKCVFWQNEKTSTITAAFGASVITGGALGQTLGSTSQQGNWDALAIILYPITLIASEARALRRSLYYLGNPAPQFDYNVVVDGTSLEAGTASQDNMSWPQQARALMSIPISLIDRGTPSATLASNISNFTARITSAYVAGKQNLVVLGGPANSINTSVTGAQTWTDTQTYIGLALAQGYRIVISTCVPMVTWDATKLGEMNAYNALVRANWATAGASGMADIASDPFLNSQNPANFAPDGVHRTNAGYAHYAAIYAPVIQALYSYR